MTQTLWITLFILLLLDLLLAAIRAGLLNARIPLLISHREHNSQGVERTLELLEKPRLRTSLRLGVVVLHFLMVGVSIWLFVLLTGSVPSFGLSLLLIGLAGLVIVVLEFALEGLILPQAEEWAIRFSGLAQVVDLVLSPISSLLLLLLGSPAMLEHRLSPVTEDELEILGRRRAARGRSGAG